MALRTRTGKKFHKGTYYNKSYKNNSFTNFRGFSCNCAKFEPMVGLLRAIRFD